MLSGPIPRIFTFHLQMQPSYDVPRSISGNHTADEQPQMLRGTS